MITDGLPLESVRVLDMPRVLAGLQIGHLFQAE